MLSRRGLIAGTLGSSLAAALGCSRSQALAPTLVPKVAPLLGFHGIPVSSADTVVVPPGYTAKVLIAWGDPISNGPTFAHDASNTSDEQLLQWGMHNDGLMYFPIDGSQHGLIAQNHEYTDDALLFRDGLANWDGEKTRKSLAAHGVSVIEVRQGAAGWQVVRPSAYARRISGLTPIALSGPAAGDARLNTSADPSGRLALGTLNNCAIGRTPWNTYLTCEENFNLYFHKTAAATQLEQRYGIPTSPARYSWRTTERRFRVDDEPNEPNRFGWVVEIDPFQPQSQPVKRTALGRFKHECACVVEARDGRVVVFSGDDEQFEYIYRYVSRLPWKQAFAQGVHPLDEGTLYVARFDEGGSGRWLPLTAGGAGLEGWSAADVVIQTRLAGDRVGATRLDRPEWIAAVPGRPALLATLTNNVRRGAEGQPAPDAANPRSGNEYGHILRWWFDRDVAEEQFHWEIFALAGDPRDPASHSTVLGDKYGSPDSIHVAPSGRVWIQTDVTSSIIDTGPYAGFGNNQMLCADPNTRETRRFLQGPRGCEITGGLVTPDEQTLFVGIQHPGEAPSGGNDPADPMRYSSWPDGPAGGRPRSALLVVTKDDGGQIGS